MAGWNPIEQARDYAIIAGKQTPGVCEIVGAGDLRKWDVQQAPGLMGAYALFMGKDLAKFTMRLKLQTLADWQGWDELRPLLAKVPRRRYGAVGGPPNAKGSGALDILHPILQQVNIKAVVVEAIKAPEQTGDGEGTINVELLEFRRPKVAMAKPDGAEAAAPTDPWDLKIEALTNQLDALSVVD
jgi:hypothetical protein